jgi:hypothetical protein
MAGMGIPEDQMVAAIINPETERPISPVTLRKHFRSEIDKGAVQATTKVGLSLYKNATTPTETYPGGIPVAQLFWLKCRARWQQNPERVVPPAPASTAETMKPEDIGIRMLFLLAKAAATKEHKAIPAPKKKVPVEP